MSKFDYDNSRLTAEKLITKFGQPNTVKIKGNDGGFDEFGDPIPPVPDTFINGITTPLLQYKSAEIDGETIQYDDSYIFFHSDIAPEIGNHTEINGKIFRVVDLMTLTSVDNINVYRKLQLRADG